MYIQCKKNWFGRNDLSLFLSLSLSSPSPNSVGRSLGEISAQKKTTLSRMWLTMYFTETLCLVAIKSPGETLSCQIPERDYSNSGFQERELFWYRIIPVNLILITKHIPFTTSFLLQFILKFLLDLSFFPFFPLLSRFSSEVLELAYKAPVDCTSWLDASLSKSTFRVS